jgi:tetratricopeptide (TPR) repeat protein
LDSWDCGFEDWLNRHQEAIHDCRESVKRFESSRCYTTLACSEIALGKNSEAIKDLTKALELNPFSAEPHYQRATAESRLNVSDQAMNDCNEAIKLNPHYSEAYSLRAILFEKLGKRELAQKDREAAAIQNCTSN